MGIVFMGLLYWTSIVMHVIICIPLGILLCTDCMNYLELLTQDYFVILLIYHMSNITLNVDLLILLTMQPNHVTRMLFFLAKMCIGNTLSETGCNISRFLCEYKISLFDIMYGNNVCALMNMSYTCTTSNSIANEKWKCNIILEMLHCLYGLSDCGFSFDEERQCLTYAATIWIFM